ncbi:hypothetical protein BV25DRAFT_1860144 [Artomyces pyxidatus]|uniref:Uncharacterized protein n=1 Tax=Artomyces pyxidatus TaxID=48021 RepID=A0ACB8SUE3_9AGAM|nr:hypothetical protein BV25DRAFT_1860144 [Artomyces pyxidatus]
MSTDLRGWHPGEVAIQRKLAFDQASATSWMHITNYMDEQHRVFHTTRLPFIPVTTLDADGRPWTSILAGADGKPGFVRSPNETQLVIKARAWDGDPWVENLEPLLSGQRRGEDEKILAAGIGIEFSTRRRNKFAGWITEARKAGERDYQLELHVNQAIGNCPKYINIRDLEPYPDARPEIAYKNLDVRGRLPDEIISFILEADTIFIGSTYKADPNDAKLFPSHVGANQRGGLPGFVRVLPSDGHTIVVPDYSGNRFMSSLGNIEHTPLAALTIVSFTTGTILYVTGHAKNLVGAPALALMPRQNALTTLTVTGAIFVRDALPVLQRPGSSVVRSPYSPPIKLLAEESEGLMQPANAGTQVRLRHIELHSASVATLEWELLGDSPGLRIHAGQAAVLDFTGLLGKPAYQHMAPGQPTALNDDRVRTWTVSSAHAGETRRFALTMRRKEGGAVTGALFAIAQKLAEHRPDILDDARPLELDIDLVGIAGEFVLEEGEGRRLLWVAGGIGVTPFLSMLARLVQMRTPADAVLALATREPKLFVGLIRRARGEDAVPGLQVRVDVFTEHAAPDVEVPGVDLVWHTGRISNEYWRELSKDGLRERQAYVCGPSEFEEAVLVGLKNVGVDVSSVKREGFASIV